MSLKVQGREPGTPAASAALLHTWVGARLCQLLCSSSMDLALPPLTPSEILFAGDGSGLVLAAGQTTEPDLWSRRTFLSPGHLYPD